MIKTSNRYKDKILNAKPNNEVIMNNNINKFTNGEEITSLKKLNRKTKRKVAKMMTKKLRNDIFKSKEMIEFTKHLRKEIQKKIVKTRMFVIETKNSAEYKGIIDLTDKSISKSFDYFDNPDVFIKEIDDNFYFVRPEEQTKSDRQTELYQLEQFLDIIKGTKKPEVTFVIRTDEEYRGKIYCYDGQHRLLLVTEFLFCGRSFSIDNLKTAIAKKKEHFGDDWWENECPTSWKSFEQFCEIFDKDNFTYDDLIAEQPELKETFNDEEIMSVFTNVHFCDSESASLLFQKLNEHYSSHSTTQRVKSYLVGSIIHKLLFKTDYDIDNGIEGKLSQLIPQIKFFNRSEEKMSKGITKKFSYDITSSDYKEMNFDQYLIFLYNSILSKVKETLDDNQTICYEFDSKLKPNESVLWSAEAFANDVWRTYGIKDSVYDRLTQILKNLIIKDKESFTEFVTNVLKAANYLTEDFITKETLDFDKKLSKLQVPYKTKRENIINQYPNKDNRNNKIVAELSDLDFFIGCLEDFKLKNHYQILPLITIILSSLPVSKFNVKDWLCGFLTTMNQTFDTYIKNQEDEFVCKGKRATLSRSNFLYQNYFNKTFINKVSENLEVKDNSLWTRIEANTYIEDILQHTDDFLYKCPHSCEDVTTDNYQSHHLNFKSSENPSKSFEHWFPLSADYNLHISNNPEKNIVKTNGNFVEACNTMIDLFNIKIKNTSGVKELLTWKKSLRTIEMWKEYADFYIQPK